MSMRREFVPVYLITGFLESGKTSLASSIFEDDRYTNGGKVLLLCCEEGETEYDPAKLEKHRVTLVNLEEAEELTSERLGKLNREIRPSCVIVEYNSMWSIDLLGKLRLPMYWDWAQIVNTADATTFENYMTNMRKLLTDPMKEADLIIINRCGPDFNKSSWRKQLRALNSNATILFENLDGSMEDGIRDEDLPYDLKAEIIDISEEQFGLMYLDSMDHPERYDGKKVRIVGQAFQKKNFPKGYYYFGRNAMTCCANDIQACGWRPEAGREDLFHPDGHLRAGEGSGRADGAAAPRNQDGAGQNAPRGIRFLCEFVKKM